MVVSVPKQVLNHLGVSAGGALNFLVQKDKVVLEKASPTYSLDELLAQCDFSREMSEDEGVGNCAKDWT